MPGVTNHPCVAGTCAGLIAALAVTALTAQPATQTEATAQLTRWLAVFNAADRAGWERFLNQFAPPPPAPLVDQNLDFHERTGGFDLVRIESASPTRAIAVVKERNSEAAGARLTIDIEAADPHRIVAVGIEPGLRLPVDIRPLNEPDLVAALGAEMTRRTAAGTFAGAVLVARNGAPIFASAYGPANRELGTANALETRFRNGSMNKMFTAVAVLTLVQAGKLGLHDPIGKHLPDYPDPGIARRVTVHQLLTHTAGTGDVFGPDFNAPQRELRRHQDYIDRFGKRPLLFEPGQRWMYSNYGFILLGAVIEKVSGQSYYDYVREQVYRPAGMTGTGSEPEDQIVTGRAVGYTRPPGTTALLPNTGTLPYRGTAAGGGYTTVGDLLRFANALAAHRLLDARNTDLLTTGKVEAIGGRYGYGFIERRVNGVRSFGHGGNAPGMDGSLEIFPESGYVVAVLANVDAPAAQRVSEFVINRLPAR